MAIDSTLFAADIPAGTYTAGDIVPLVNIDGPANVRSGRGKAILKQILCGAFADQVPYWRIHVKNSDWIDEVISLAGPLRSATSLDDHSSLIQFGCDNDLTENSGWQIFAECVAGGTSTAANSLFALIDIDYPSVSAVSDPDTLIGAPTSIDYDVTVDLLAHGALVGSSWSTKNVDYFKAGYQYCIQAVEMICPTAVCSGFMAFSSAAGMGGLTRIIPVYSTVAAIRYKLRYASKLTKGPMDVKLKLFNTSASTGANVKMIHDYVKRSI